MSYLLDTNVVIQLREADPQITRLLDDLTSPRAISLLTWVELEGGVHTDPRVASFRRASIEALIAETTIMPITPAIVRAYSDIVAARGFSRPRVIDRLIAATALVNGLTLVTINADDFRDVPDLALEVWPAPA